MAAPKEAELLWPQQLNKLNYAQLGLASVQRATAVFIPFRIWGISAAVLTVGKVIKSRQ